MRPKSGNGVIRRTGYPKGSVPVTQTSCIQATELALFLDFDGTLVDLATSPDTIAPTSGLIGMLAELRLRLDGACAIVSGRRLSDLAQYVGASGLDLVGLHGAEARTASGGWHAQEALFPEDAAASIRAFAQLRPGVLIEDKGAGLALHWRGCPAAGEDARALLADLHHSRLFASHRLLFGKCVGELVPPGHDKGAAVERLMRAAPCHGRRLAFIGDDTTDEAAFSVANARGGLSVKVGGGATGASYRLADVSQVHAMLRGLLLSGRLNLSGLTSVTPSQRALV